MTAFNTLRFKVKPGRDEEFIAAHRSVERNWPAIKSANLIQTGEHAYGFVGEWIRSATRSKTLAAISGSPTRYQGWWCWN